jgi:site-specific DNA recombinase
MTAILADDSTGFADAWTFRWTGLPQPYRTVLLLRISDARDDDTDGVDRQLARLLAYARSNGWRIGPDATHVITENDTSAYKRRMMCVQCMNPGRACTCPPLPGGAKRRAVLRTVRPEFHRALEMLRTGQADGLLALDLDRACRDPRDLEDLLDAAMDNGVPRIPVHSTTGSLSLMTSSGVDMARTMIMVANKSSRDTARRVTEKREAKAKMGQNLGGMRPYGWGVPRIDRETGQPIKDEATGRVKLDTDKLVEAEGAEIKNWADQVLAGVSLRTITADLRGRSAPTVKGKPGGWETPTVRDILLRPRNAGLVVYKVREAAQAYKDRGEPVPYDCGVIPGATGTWEPILDEDTWRAVAVLLTDPSRRTTPGGTPRWLGSLVYRCGVCAAAGVAETVSVNGAINGRGPSYFCRGPVGHLRRSVAGVDGYVTDVIVARLAQPDAAGLLASPKQGPDRAKLSREANRLRQNKAAVVSLVADGTISPADAREQIKALSDRLSAIDGQLAVTAARSPLDALPLGTDRVQEAWERLPLGSQRAIVRLLADVTLHNGRPGRAPISPEYRAHRAGCAQCRDAAARHKWDEGCAEGAKLHRESYYDFDSIDIAWRQ